MKTEPAHSQQPNRLPQRRTDARGVGPGWPAASGSKRGTCRVLILSGGLGAGHDSLASACAGQLSRCGVETKSVDCMSSLGRRGGAVGSAVFRRLLASPIYDSFHFQVLHSNGTLVRWADQRATRRLYGALRSLAETWRPDVLLPVFATGVHVACLLKAEGVCRSVVTCLPDAAGHRLWVDPGVDLFLVGSPLGATSVRRYWPEAPVRVVDLPLDPSFSSTIDGRRAREQLGVPADARCVLLMAGAWGLGRLDVLAGRLAREGIWVLAVAGRDAKLGDRLRRTAARYPSVRSFGFCDHIAELMAASDLVVTTPGMTAREARAVGRSLVLLDLVPGHGRENLLYELLQGQAAWAGSDPDVVARIVLQELQRPVVERSGRAAQPSQFLSAFRELGILAFEPRPQTAFR